MDRDSSNFIQQFVDFWNREWKVQTSSSLCISTMCLRGSTSAKTFYTLNPTTLICFIFF